MKNEKSFLTFSLINIDKSAGPTSYSISEFVKRKLKLKKTSHMGTLDPKVTGILICGINKATSTYIDQLESTTCDFLMVSNVAAKKEFDKGNLSNEASKYNKVYVIGEAEQKKGYIIINCKAKFIFTKHLGNISIL